jgi:hypothetical protein
LFLFSRIHNVELRRYILIDILEYFKFSHLITQLTHDQNRLSQKQQQMILSLSRRKTTRDLNFIHRFIIAELALYGMPDSTVKRQECIQRTARCFRLGMSHADIAFPMAYE